MPDGSNMKQEQDYGLQAAHMLISELLRGHLDLIARNLALEARLKMAEARAAELEPTAAP